MNTDALAPAPIWKNRNFPFLFSSFLISGLGDWLDLLGITILFTYLWHVQPIYVALIPVSFALPSVLFSQIAGVLADRLDKRTLMIGTDLLRCGLTVLLVFAPNPLVVILLLLFRSLGSIFNDPAFQALTRWIVTEDQVLQLVSVTSLARTITKVAGPIGGGLIAAQFSPHVCLLINACSFLLSAILLLLMGRVKMGLPSAQPKQAKTTRMADEWKIGWQQLLHNRLLLGSTVYFLIGFAALFFVESQTNILMRQVAPAHPEWIGYSISCFGLGGVGVSLLIKKWKDLRPYYGHVLGGGLASIGVSFGLEGFFTPQVPLYWVVTVSVVGGVGVGLVFIGFSFLQRRETPKEMLGRILGITQSLSSAVTLLFPLSGAIFATTFGVMFTFQMIGGMLVLLGGCGFLLRHLVFRVPMQVAPPPHEVQQQA